MGGVICDNVTGNVIGLDLHGSCSWLRGTIDDNSTLFRLSHLQSLNLAFNNFLGSRISPEFGRLKELTYLNPSFSNFGGLVPSEISHLSKLTHLGLSCRVLTIEQRTFDLLASNLTKLSLLHLGSTNLSLIKPFSLLNLSSTMTDLDLSGTRIQGNFPDQIFLLPNLRVLYLCGNIHLTGYLPKCNWSSPLRELDLSLSDFSGEIPYSIGNLLFLETVDITYCNFMGSIPTSTGNLSKATEILFASNHLTGQLPHHVSGLLYLTNLDLFGNSLQGKVPSWLFTLPSLVSVNLAWNKLTGPIDGFQSPNSLEEVHLEKNQIHGTIPSSLFQLVDLTHLDLSSNNLSGSVALSGLKSLIDLDLSNNFLTHIALHPWKNIRTLDLRNNKIQGSILVPPPSTEVFLVSNNKLSGQIPPYICSLSSLKYLSLSHNNLSGTIPPCLGNFTTQLITLHLKNNSLEGHIHDTFENASNIQSFDLNCNKFEGSLPRSLAKCVKLEVVNVGNNMINDTFPCWLGSLPLLKILILRSNRFYGPLCKSITTFSFQALRIIDLSRNEFKDFLPRRNFTSMEAMKNVDEQATRLQYMGHAYYDESVTVAMKGHDFQLYMLNLDQIYIPNQESPGLAELSNQELRMV
ncbi:hypothetical protein WN943_014647 [Citrus x changshan-huyou]